MKNLSVTMRQVHLPIIFCAALLATACSSQSYKPIALDGFEDVIKHWHDQNEGGSDSYFQPHEIVGIADTMLLYQRSNGGWPTNKDPLRKLKGDELEKIKADVLKNDASLDNRNTYPQVRYLAAAYQQTGDLRYRQAVLDGLNYILSNQYPNGGWSHSPPRTERYYGHITFADEVMPGVLHLMRDIHQNHPDFDFLSDVIKSQCSRALAKGDKLLLDLQIDQDGERTIWAGQYDKETLQPVAGRAYELPGLLSWESVAVVEYLMSIPNPSAEVIEAVESAVAWFQAAQIRGIRIEKFETPPVRFDYHTSTYDLKVAADANAEPVWARFYDLATNEPFFANRDGSRVGALAEVKRDRRTGYSWYGDWPKALLEQSYPQWKAKLTR